MRGTIKSTWEAGRLLGFTSLFKQTCFNLNLTIDFLEVDKGWFSESGPYIVSGEADNLYKFRDWLEGINNASN